MIAGDGACQGEGSWAAAPGAQRACEQGGPSPAWEGRVKTPNGQIRATAVTPPRHSPAPLAPPFPPCDPPLVPQRGGSESRALSWDARQRRGRRRQTCLSGETIPPPRRAPPPRSGLQHLMSCHGRDAATMGHGQRRQGEGTRRGAACSVSARAVCTVCVVSPQFHASCLVKVKTSVIEEENNQNCP